MSALLFGMFLLNFNSLAILISTKFVAKHFILIPFFTVASK